MKQAWFRFYEELNDFLPTVKRKVLFPYQFTGTPTVKDAVEDQGVPHVEIDMILVNGQSVDFLYKIRNEDRISVYPVFESLDISGVTHLRGKPLREIKFIADVHLGKLVKYLRLCGLDTFFSRSMDDNQIIDLSLSEKRIILTRDRLLLKNKKVTHGYWIRSKDAQEQLMEVFRRFSLQKSVSPFTRCLECNGMLERIEKEKITDRLQPRTRKYYNEFRICPACDHIYWEGSHFSRMKQFTDRLIAREIQ